MYDAQVDEASIMQHTGHRSVTGVRAYKRRTEKLEELTSAVLNQTSVKRPLTKIGEEGIKHVIQATENIEQKENKEAECSNIPTMPWSFEGASGFTINFNFK